jgi:hypothetical protein
MLLVHSVDVSISLRIEIIASQKRSNSATSSDSVGSIIKVPATGKETVERENHNPLVAISTTSIPFFETSHPKSFRELLFPVSPVYKIDNVLLNVLSYNFRIAYLVASVIPSEPACIHKKLNILRQSRKAPEIAVIAFSPPT